ncbi:MAG: serine/threonine protein kinase [Lentisphaerae bacterium]|nr:serine/threonine protein kinase [Lentisphaerota bacterium]MCP4101812.1 serine/threonine protein kinase [Lentisphaerota bacterium]
MRYFCRKCHEFTERDQDKCCTNCGASLVDAPMAPGTDIGGFEIITEIGRGANGVVYLAKQLTLERDVALKVLPEQRANDPEFVKNFLKEARAAAKLNHPNIVQAYDAGVSSLGTYFFAMEYISGRTLDENLKENGPLKVAQAINIALKVAEALDYAWEKQRLFHGDIKPDNIIMRNDGDVKLADLGLAATIFEEKSEEVMATPMYAPPEVIRGEHDKFGCKTDMYSFGASLYELFSGEPPHNEYDCGKVLEMHLHEAHMPLKEKLTGFPQNASDLVDSLLAKNPDERPDSWKEVIEQLQEIQEAGAEKSKSGHNNFKKIIFFILPALIILSGIVFYYLKESKKNDVPAIITATLDEELHGQKSTGSPKSKIFDVNKTA